ncbi:hypothetical protein [Velocimicrobium porci]|uniref:Uncharacterized protein n=1 Tax=Velocimicrobium porci TaxID=2606634 RepID=A0A6L5XVQ0_9FIRM|nr:hypothetical protein [Velocimicrobium porci]MSS62587.1 hypothetical protein [Velocimicrobium porci]
MDSSKTIESNPKTKEKIRSVGDGKRNCNIYKENKTKIYCFGLLKNGITIGCIGIGIGAAINLMSCIFPIYKAVFISIIIAILTTMIGILLFGVFHFPKCALRRTFLMGESP